MKELLDINSSQTEEIRVNKIVNQGLRLNREDIKRSSEFCYLGSTVAENGGTCREVNVRIQKARESLCKLRKVWLSKSLRKDTKIRIFNACVKSVLLYGCETQLVTNEIQRKIQTFENRCLRYAECPSRNVPDFLRVFLMLNYTDITQNTYVQI